MIVKLQLIEFRFFVKLKMIKINLMESDNNNNKRVRLDSNSNFMSNDMLLDSSSSCSFESNHSDVNSIGETGNQQQDQTKVKRKRQRLNNLSQEEKIMRRKLKNRVAAQNARDRKKAKMDELDHDVVILREQNGKLKLENQLLKEQNRLLQNENKSLKFKLSTPAMSDVIVTDIIQKPCDSQIVSSVVVERSAVSSYVSQQQRQHQHLTTIQVSHHQELSSSNQQHQKAVLQKLVYALIFQIMSLIKLDKSQNDASKLVQLKNALLRLESYIQHQQFNTLSLSSILRLKLILFKLFKLVRAARNRVNSLQQQQQKRYTQVKHQLLQVQPYTKNRHLTQDHLKAFLLVSMMIKFLMSQKIKKTI